MDLGQIFLHPIVQLDSTFFPVAQRIANIPMLKLLDHGFQLVLLAVMLTMPMVWHSFLGVQQCQSAHSTLQQHQEMGR